MIKEIGIHHLYANVSISSATAYYSFLSKTPTIYFKHVRKLEFCSSGKRSGRYSFAEKADKYITLLEKRIKKDLKAANRGRKGTQLPETVLDYLDQSVIVTVSDRELVGLGLFLM